MGALGMVGELETGGVGHGLQALTRREGMVPQGAEMTANVKVWLFNPEGWTLLIYNVGSKICWHAVYPQFKPRNK